MIAELHTNAGMFYLPCTRIAYRDSRRPPYGSISLVVKSPPHIRPARFGEWIVVRLVETGPAVSWGIVTRVANSQRVGDTGAPNRMTWQVECIGWFDLLGRTDFQIASNLDDKDYDPDDPDVDRQRRNSAGVGTLFGARELVTLAKAAAGPVNPLSPEAISRGLGQYDGIFQALASLRGVGAGLSLFLGQAARLDLPDTLGNATIGQSVRVIHNDATVTEFSGDGVAERQGGPALVMDAVPGRALPNLTPYMASTKLLSTIRGTWGGDENLIEMFPALEDPGTVNPESSPNDDLAKLRRAADALPTPDYVSTQPRSDTLDNVQGPSGNARKLIPGAAEVLGRNPVLVYRMAPWRTQPLSDWVQVVAEYDERLARLRRRVTDFVSTSGRWNRITWDTSNAAILSAVDDTVSMEQSSTDDDAPNVFTSEWPGSGSPAGFMLQAGLPIVFLQAAGLGVKLYTAQWPFIRDQQQTAQTEAANPNLAQRPDSLTNEAVTVAAQAAQFMAYATNFFSGTIRSRFRPDVRPGMVVLVQWPDDERQFSAYVDTVEHSAEFLQDGSGRIMRRTSVQFIRGLWNEAERYELPPLVSRRANPEQDAARRGIESNPSPTTRMQGARGGVATPTMVDDGVTPLREMMPPTGLE